jgi:two-component system LytT family response regulator
MLRVMLIDDERLARQALRGMLAPMPDVEIVAEAADVAGALEIVTREKPHALFLDVQMPRANGFELLRQLETPPKVAFVTAYSEHAVRAFDVDAVDYLLKPVRASRLAQAVTRLREACGLGDAAESQPLAPRDRICLRHSGRTIVATLDRVLALEADGDFTRVFVTGEPPMLICQKLGAYERELPSPPFARVDRSLILNVPAITRTQRESRDEERVWFDGLAEPFVLGRVARQRLHEALGA